MATPTGRFVWHEIVSTDLETSIAFFQKLFGWEVKDSGMPDMDYRMAFAGEQAVAGFVALDPAHGQPSHWIGYVAVPDVDAAIDGAKKAGAAVPVEPMEIDQVGRFGVLVDPQGGAIAPFKGAGEGPPDPEGMAPGCVCWAQYNGHDIPAASDFYAGLFDWTITKTDDPAGGDYWMVNRADGGEVGGMMPMPEGLDEVPSHWLYYVCVNDVDATVETATGLGAMVHVPPTDIPGMGRFAVMADPTGGGFAVFAGADG